jgi:hypothetical protein
MTALEELINIISEFTPEQLEEFLRHPVTESILQPVKEAGSFLQEVS